jgi:plasmid maintenance system antidote protein VapI
MNLQTKYDLDLAQDAVAEQIVREVMPQDAA